MHQYGDPTIRTFDCQEYTVKAACYGGRHMSQAETHGMTKKERILQLLKENPRWQHRQVADAVGTTSNYVATVKSRWDGEKTSEADALVREGARLPQTPSDTPESQWPRVEYGSLNSKQKEIYNFQKSAALLADFGFNCIKLSDDWQGADFLAYHKDGNETLRVQLKARLTVDKKYCGRGLWMNFPADGSWYLVQHDELVRILGEATKYLTSRSWMHKGSYSNARPSRALLDCLARFRVGDHASVGSSQGEPGAAQS